MLKQTLEWLNETENLKIEIQQCKDEGRNFGLLEKHFRCQVENPEETVLSEEESAVLFEKISLLPVDERMARKEPSDLKSINAIQRKRVDFKYTSEHIDKEIIADKIRGAWLGRISGCLLGKPFEGWPRKKIISFLKETGNYPIQCYASSDVGEELRKKYDLFAPLPGKDAWIDLLEHAPVDDDTNYTLMGLKIIEGFGRDFKAHDVAQSWLANLPVLELCTAERIAYRNFLNLVEPPESAVCKNPFREWIGAQIRADFYGYINPGNPQEAARMAWIDASISHVRNGIYGSMFVAAMLAAASCENSTERIIQIGLSCIPPESRLSEGIDTILEYWKKGATCGETLQYIYCCFDEGNMHHWSHVIPNALIVCTSLLFGQQEFDKTLNLAVTAGFDTDCNAATCGSVLGMIMGAKKHDGKWIEPLNGTLASTVKGFQLVDINSIAGRTVKLI